MIRHLIESLLSKYDEQQRMLALFGLDDGNHAARTALMAALPTLPDWHEKPTMPGLWVCMTRFDEDYSMQLTADDIERGKPLSASRVYGPIPPYQETTKQ